MAHEFDFLRSRWPRLAALGNDAARIMEASPSASVRTLNRFCEMAAIMAMEQLKITSIPDDTQEDRLDALKTSGAPAEILTKFNNVLASSQSLSPLGDVDTAAACVQDCQDIGRWLLRQAEGAVYVQGAHTVEQAPPTRVYSNVPEEANSDYVPQRVEYTPAENGPVHRSRNNSEARPVSGSETPAGDHNGFNLRSFLPEGLGRVNWMIVAAIAVVIVVIIVLLTLLSKNDPGKSTLPTATPTDPSYTVPVATLVPTPAPTLDPSFYMDYVETMTPDASLPEWFDTYFKGKWTANQHSANFKIGDESYDHGIGMFIKSKKIVSTHESVSLVYNTNGRYDELLFDLGADPDWSYGEKEEEYGTFRVMVYLDDAADPAYDSDFQNGSFIANDIDVDISGAQSVRIKLTQSKGSKGTLSIVLGDLRMHLTEEAVNAIPEETQATPAPVEGEDQPAASPAPEDVQATPAP